MEQNDIGCIIVAICGGYISKYSRLDIWVKAIFANEGPYRKCRLVYKGDPNFVIASPLDVIAPKSTQVPRWFVRH